MTDKKKALLNEATTRRFWKLAGIAPLHEKAYLFEEDEELEEIAPRGARTSVKEEEAIEEELDEMYAASEDEPVDDMAMDDEAPVGDEEGPEMDMGDEGEAEDVEVDVPEEDVASLRTARDVIDQILSAVEGGEEEPDMEEPDMEEPEEPAMDEEEPLEMGPEELEETVEKIATRVAARIQEVLKK